MENKIVVEDWSPLGNIQAIVEKSEFTYYLYLWINPESDNPKMKVCWVCNRVKAPASMNEAFAMTKEAPCMPVGYVTDPGGIDLKDDDLSIEWYEESDSAALLMGERIIAVVPSFSGMKDFHGYSAYASECGPYAWPLKEAYDTCSRELEISRKFWAYFDEEDFFSKVQESQMDSLEGFFGKHDKYYAIDNDEFPPKALVTGEKDGILYAVTLGVGMFPMPTVEMAYGESYHDYRRMELGFACDPKYKENLNSVYSAMSFLASFPWLELTFLGHGHTIPFTDIKGFDYLLFLNANDTGSESPVYEKFMGERINLLWIRPITRAEHDLIVSSGVEEYLKDKDLKKIHVLE